jgi:hypothetical protein
MRTTKSCAPAKTETVARPEEPMMMTTMGRLISLPTFQQHPPPAWLLLLTGLTKICNF